MPLTTDPNDPRLGRKTGPDDKPVPQNEVYLVLSEEEIDKGYVRPVRCTYIHVGIPGPKYPLRDLSDEQKDAYRDSGYIKYEAYPEEMRPSLGRFWTQKQLDNVGKGCKTVTTVSLSIAKTYARNPHFYGATYCAGCRMHRSVGKDGEFVWEDGTRVGT
jgi:hypothetical protein